MKGSDKVVASTVIVAMVFIMSNLSDVAVGFYDKKNVVITNNHTNYLSIRCFSFDEDKGVRHLTSMGEYEFTVNIRNFIPSSTMFNCSTNMGTFVAFRLDYECVGHPPDVSCEWMFDEDYTYLFDPTAAKWVLKEYNPNYESLNRGGVIQGYYVN